MLVIGFVIIGVVVLKEWCYLPFVVGIVLYLLYVMKVGGDFMSGRFFAAPLFVAVILLSFYRFSSEEAYRVTFLIILAVGFSSPYLPLSSNENYGIEVDTANGKGVVDERAYYYQRSGFLKDSRFYHFPGTNYAGNMWNVEEENYPQQVALILSAGYSGYEKGPSVHVIDRYALLDPLMARLPVIDKRRWRIGHFPHILPDGYLQTLTCGENMITDESLALYYEKLSIVTRGELFDWNRISEIWNLNTGKYDDLIDAYLAKWEIQGEITHPLDEDDWYSYKSTIECRSQLDPTSVISGTNGPH